MLMILFSVFSFSLLIPFLDVVFQKSVEDYQNIVALGMPSFYPNPKYFLELFTYKIAGVILNHSNGKMKVLTIICATILVAILLKNIAHYLAMYFAANVRNGVVRDIRKSLYDKLLSLDVDYFTKHQKGDLISRSSHDINEIQYTVLTSIEMIFRDPFGILLIFSFLFAIHVKLTLFVLIVIPVTGAIIGVLGSNLRKSAKLSSEYAAQVMSFFEESISGLKIIKGFGAKDYMKSRFDALNQQLMRLNIKVMRQKDLASPLSEFLSVVILISVVWFGGMLIIKESTLDSSEFIGFLALFSQVIPHVKGIATAQMNLNRGAAAAERIQHFLNLPQKIIPPKKTERYKGLSHSIECKDVSFSYDQKTTVLNAVNLTIHKGETLALVGPSGGGKTTLTDLLARFYDATQGAIYIDQKNIKELDLQGYYNTIGMVTQDTFLFHDTILNNIRFNTPKADDQKVIQAAKLAYADQFIQDFPQGYQTIVGDRGNKLSGGQKQRISLARAFLKDPQILILDEATSALDAASEEWVQKALETLMKDRTTIIIAHRLSTIQKADKIAVIDKGRVIEVGMHETLIKKQGAYKKLYELQVFS